MFARNFWFVLISAVVLGSANFALAASANQCRDLFSVEGKAKAKASSGVRVHEGFVKTRGGREMFTVIDKPAAGEPKEYVLLIHGLMDNLTKWDKIAERLLAKGYGVLRVDLNGHGETLRRSIEKGEPIPTSIDFAHQLDDLHDVLMMMKRKHGIVRPNVVGHSYGGGVTIALAAHPEYSGDIGDKVFPIAPYVYRMDWRQIEKTTILHPVVAFWWRSLQAEMPNLVRESLESWTTDPAMDLAMAHGYGIHAEKEVAADHPEFAPEQAQAWKKALVDAAIAATKGIRPFDSRMVGPYIDPRIQVLMAINGKDELLDQPLELEFFNSIGAPTAAQIVAQRSAQEPLQNPAQRDARLTIFDGTGHFVTRQAPALVARWILDGLEGRVQKERIVHRAPRTRRASEATSR